MVLIKIKLVLIIMFINTIMASLTYSQNVLDVAQYRFSYKHSWQFDTLTYNDTREDLLILLIGQNISKCFSYYTFQSDSLSASQDGDKVRREAWIKAFREAKNGIPQHLAYTKRMRTYVYKNYPAGQITVTDGINLNEYIFTDDLHSQEWMVSDSTKVIMNYSCQMAECDFRGRHWTAWFAPDIPISDGPWKFSGLPGLIMEVYDTRHHYKFTIVGIENLEDEPIVFSPVVTSSTSLGRYDETTRIAFLKGLAQYTWNQSRYMNAELGIETFDESSSSKKPHDLIERDYW